MPTDGNSFLFKKAVSKAKRDVKLQERGRKRKAQNRKKNKMARQSRKQNR